MEEIDWFHKGNTSDKYKEVFIDLKNPKQWLYPDMTMDGYLGNVDNFGRFLVQGPIFKSKTDEEATDKFANAVLKEFGKGITKENNFVYSYLLNYIKKEMPLDEDDVYNCGPLILVHSQEDRFILHRFNKEKLNQEYFLDIKRQGNNICGNKVFSNNIRVLNFDFDDYSWTLRERLEEAGPYGECNTFNIFQRQDGTMSVQEDFVNLLWDKDWVLLNSVKSLSQVSSDGDVTQTERLYENTNRCFCGYAEDDTLTFEIVRDCTRTFNRQGDFVKPEQVESTGQTENAEQT